MQTPENLKTECGEESFNPDGLAQRSIKLLKDTFPDIEVCIMPNSALPATPRHCMSNLACAPDSQCIVQCRMHGCRLGCDSIAELCDHPQQAVTLGMLHVVIIFHLWHKNPDLCQHVC